MIIAIAGGHGGAGRTTVATSLALTLMQTGRTLGLEGSVALADGDVDKPATDLLLHPLVRSREPWTHPVPQATDRCTGCGACADGCRFHAIALFRDQPVFFPELCSGCLACVRDCPEQALIEDHHDLGVMTTGRVGSLRWVGGTLDIGGSWPRPLIRAVIERARQRPHAALIIDGPAGTSLAALEALRPADVALVVVEPSPIGLAALQRSLAVIQGNLSCPAAVLLNKAGTEDLTAELTAQCAVAGVPIVGRLAFSLRVARAYAQGVPLVREWPEQGPFFQTLYRRLCEVAAP